ncbi:MAG: hypothetical protein AAFN50_04395 [Pseudomonadota bacterium]
MNELIKWFAIVAMLLGAQSLRAQDGGLGYVAVRLTNANPERIAKFEWTNHESGFVVKVDSSDCKPAGADARMCIVPATPGRYYWSRYQTISRFRLEDSLVQEPPMEREGPDSPQDTFEVVPAAINYIGDWEMKKNSVTYSTMSPRHQFKVDVVQNANSLSKIYTLFPELANTNDLYLSMMGKQAISIERFLEIVKQNTD